MPTYDTADRVAARPAERSTSQDAGSDERGLAIITQPQTPVTAVAVPSAQRLAYVSDIRQLVHAQSEALHDWTLRIGETLTRLRDYCRADSRLWTSLFPTSTAETCDEKKLPFSRATAHKLMAIYRNETLRVSHAKHQLPADWESLYQLSRVPADRLSSALKSGEISAHSTRTDVRRVANRLDPKNASVYQPAPKSMVIESKPQIPPGSEKKTSASEPRVIEGDSPLMTGAPSAASQQIEPAKPVRSPDSPTHYRWHDAGAEMRALVKKYAKKSKRERIYQAVLLMDLLGIYDEMEAFADRKAAGCRK